MLSEAAWPSRKQPEPIRLEDGVSSALAGSLISGCPTQPSSGCVGFANPQFRAQARNCHAERSEASLPLLKSQARQRTAARCPTTFWQMWTHHVARSERKRGTVMPSAARHPYPLLKSQARQRTAARCPTTVWQMWTHHVARSERQRGSVMLSAARYPYPSAKLSSPRLRQNRRNSLNPLRK